ncbi:hypothetical protein, partial [Planktotalea sp.]|uniref:hypothetical protein n=1 Tax=Planktotalea sp. TaxID=2029877 RepID=UPI0035C804B6
QRQENQTASREIWVPFFFFKPRLNPLPRNFMPTHSKHFRFCLRDQHKFFSRTERMKCRSAASSQGSRLVQEFRFCMQ